MVYTYKWKNQEKRQFIHFNKNLNDFVIGGNANIFLVENEAQESQAGCHYNNPDRNVRSVVGKITACQNQVEGDKNEARISKWARYALKTVKNRLHDAFSTTMDNVVTPRVELAVSSIIV